MDTWNFHVFQSSSFSSLLTSTPGVSIASRVLTCTQIEIKQTYKEFRDLSGSGPITCCFLKSTEEMFDSVFITLAGNQMGNWPTIPIGINNKHV
ncbi:hypothetical protein M8J75_011741 [Diaphorina citri]|nr:hypothetical protein M8J75_011741 [Diaphorina citri]